MSRVLVCGADADADAEKVRRALGHVYDVHAVAPATLAEIAAASGLPAEEIHRFVNANLATGYAEPFVETPPEPADAGKSGGFFSRLRGR